jgi:hypothetical protein
VEDLRAVAEFDSGLGFRTSAEQRDGEQAAQGAQR